MSDKKEIGQEMAEAARNGSVFTALVYLFTKIYDLVLNQSKDVLAVSKEGRVFELSGRGLKNHFEIAWFKNFKMPIPMKTFSEAIMTFRQVALEKARQVKLVNDNYYWDESGSYFKNEGGRQVRVTGESVSEITVADSPVIFTGNRWSSFVAFVPPVATLITILGKVCRLTDGQLMLFVGCILKAFLPGPNPVMIFVGEQGSGKTFLANIFQMIVDPARTGERVRILDNISVIGDKLSDELCRESHNRVIIATTICDLMPNQDLVDRTILFNLRPIKNSERQPESKLRAYLAVNLGGIMQVIALALSQVAKNYHNINISYPRLADFTHCCMAAASSCQSLGFNEGEFMTALISNRANGIEQCLNDNPVSAAIIFFTESYGNNWTGTATALHAKLKEIAPLEMKNHSNWPSKPNKLSAMIRRAAPFLRTKGIEVSRGKSGERTITITRLDDKAAESAEQIEDAVNHQSESDLTGELGNKEKAPHDETKATIVANALDNNKPHDLDVTETDADTSGQDPVATPPAEKIDVSGDESAVDEQQAAV